MRGSGLPEHLEWVMHGGTQKPREVIDKVIEGSLSEADYNLLERNMRADFGSGQPDRMKADIEKFKRTLGLGIYKLEPGAGNFIVGSYGMAKLRSIDQGITQEMYFTPVAPEMALFCTAKPECCVITRQDEKGNEMLHKMNTATWNASHWIAAASRELLEVTKKTHKRPAEPIGLCPVLDDVCATGDPAQNLHSRLLCNTWVHSEKEQIVVRITVDRSARSKMTRNNSSAHRSASGT